LEADIGHGLVVAECVSASPCEEPDVRFDRPAGQGQLAATSARSRTRLRPC